MTKTGEYKGNKTITLMKDESDRWPFSFGLAKAKLILENLDEITKFVEEAELGKKETKAV
jgi:hypothetical protein